MKLAAMEGLYQGSVGQSLVGVGILKPEASRTPDNPMAFSIEIPKGLSYLIYSEGNKFVPGINDLIEGITINAEGDTVHSLSYADKIAIGKTAQQALREYSAAYEAGDKSAMDTAAAIVKENFRYGYLPSPQAAVPNVDLTFYSFRIMVMAGGYLLALFVLVLFLCYRRTEVLEKAWLCWLGMTSVAVVWVCSQSGWVLAEAGRQPWVIQDLMPVTAGISGIPASSVQLTFWIFAFIFTALLIAEISIMLRYISSASKTNIEKHSL